MSSVPFDIARATCLPAVHSPESAASHEESTVNACVKLLHRLENDGDDLRPSLGDFIESYQALPLIARARVENWFVDMDELNSVTQDKFEVDTYQAKFYGVDVLIRMHTPEDDEEYPTSRVQNEIRAMAQLRHPNIASFLGAHLSCEHCFVVTECMPSGSLRCLWLSKQAQQRDWRPKTDQALAWALDLARAVTYLHHSDPSVTHRNLRPETLFIASSGCLKISGFGRCALLPLGRPSPRCDAGSDRGLRSPCSPGGEESATDPYAAPELRSDAACADPAVDVFSIAAIVRCLRTGRDTAPRRDSKRLGPGCLGLGARRAPLSAVLAAAAAADPADRPAADAIMRALEEARRRRAEGRVS